MSDDEPDAGEPPVLDPSRLFDLTGRRALVIGGTGVLGGRAAKVLGAAGANVTVVGRSAERGGEVADHIRALGGTAEFVRADVASRDDLDALADHAVRTGGLDVLVNAAAINSTTPFADIDDAEWDRVLDVDLSAVFRACRSLVPALRGRPDGASIVNYSSTASGPPLSKVLTYAVAKAGVNSLTQYLARELAPDLIRVNALVPGFFPAAQNREILDDERIRNVVDHTPMRRLGRTHELDGAVLWLSSSASSFVTGALIRVDGGFSAMTI
jgi:NAD(P)-dependent dehydrogenase (short-subunit alcohol dehydrogenase family)